MLFLDHTQVQYCKVKDKEKDKLISGLIYNGYVFLKAKAFPKEELEAAIKECREEYLDHKERSQIATLLVKETSSVGIWMHDKKYTPEDASITSQPDNEPNVISNPTKSNTNRISTRQLALEMRSPKGVEIKTRRQKLKLYQRCFLGNEAVDWMVQRVKVSRPDAVKLGQKMLEKGLIMHVLDEHPFKDEGLFYRFREDDGKSLWDSSI